MAVTPNYSWPVPDDTDLVKDGAEAIRDLGNAIDTTVDGLPSGGLVHINTTTFTSTTSQSVDNIFTTDFNNYRITITTDAQGAGARQYVKLRAGATDSSASYYTGVWLLDSSGTLNATENNLTTGFFVNASNTTFLSTSFDILQPYIADRTRIIGLSSSRFASSVRLMSFGGVHDIASSYDGITLLNDGNRSGIITVYGYRK